MRTTRKNIILSVDSYKLSMPVQYPEGTEVVYSYIESRGGMYPKTLFLGTQGFIYDYLMTPITKADIDEAEEIITAHGEPFYRENWEYILNKYNGFLPLRIRALDEGSVVPTHTVLLTIENTDPKCFWLTTHVETALLRAIWYPTTVASNSFTSRQVIKQYLEDTGDVNGLAFKLHDFGARGVSSGESAEIGGFAHLATGAMGTDTVESLVYARRVYGTSAAAFSIPAMEHSTVTSWGRDGEAKAFANMLAKYAKPGSIVACVSDSYDLEYAVREVWGKTLKEQVIASGATIVVRPDSGDPATVVLDCVRWLDEAYGSTVNAKGFKVLNNVRVIQGDGITTESIRGILMGLKFAGYSADNVAFGQGGALLQQVNRDTNRFAMKCSAIRIGNKRWIDVFKSPKGDATKVSKKGRFAVVKDENGELRTVDAGFIVQDERNLLKLRYENGVVYNTTTLTEIRERANT
jgi:nicotinamide phosphoribosyltransferase